MVDTSVSHYGEMKMAVELREEKREKKVSVKDVGKFVK
jgi:hypothetical protein